MLAIFVVVRFIDIKQFSCETRDSGKKHTQTKKKRKKRFAARIITEKKVVTDHKLSKGHESNRQPTDSCAAPF